MVRQALRWLVTLLCRAGRGAEVLSGLLNGGYFSRAVHFRYAAHGLRSPAFSHPPDVHCHRLCMPPLGGALAGGERPRHGRVRPVGLMEADRPWGSFALCVRRTGCVESPGPQPC